uniref:Methyltransferase domain-containing protein n=1 Tax=Streptomyces sp. NBC_01393 TaxID=2903851 RepID=A0AAU3IAF3_9ACTN
MTEQSFKQSRDVAQFQNWGPTYEDSRIQQIRDRIHQSLVDWVGEQGVRPQNVLDVGCGTGALLRRVGIRFPNAELTGVDVSPSMVETARAKVPEGLPVTFVHGAAEQLPFEDESFDLVVSTICFHHWRSRNEGLAEIQRVLKPGGRVFIADHYAVGWLRPFFAVTRCRDRVHTREELTRMYGAAGLRVDRWKLLDRLAKLPFIHGIGAVKP